MGLSLSEEVYVVQLLLGAWVPYMDELVVPSYKRSSASTISIDQTLSGNLKKCQLTWCLGSKTCHGCPERRASCRQTRT